jgi:hypothetical protein
VTELTTVFHFQPLNSLGYRHIVVIVAYSPIANAQEAAQVRSETRHWGQNVIVDGQTMSRSRLGPRPLDGLHSRPCTRSLPGRSDRDASLAISDHLLRHTSCKMDRHSPLSGLARAILSTRDRGSDSTSAQLGTVFRRFITRRGLAVELHQHRKSAARGGVQYLEHGSWEPVTQEYTFQRTDVKRTRPRSDQRLDSSGDSFRQTVSLEASAHQLSKPRPYVRPTVLYSRKLSEWRSHPQASGGVREIGDGNGKEMSPGKPISVAPWNT